MDQRWRWVDKKQQLVCNIVMTFTGNNLYLYRRRAKQSESTNDKSRSDQGSHDKENEVEMVDPKRESDSHYEEGVDGSAPEKMATMVAGSSGAIQEILYGGDGGIKQEGEEGMFDGGDRGEQANAGEARYVGASSGTGGRDCFLSGKK